LYGTSKDSLSPAPEDLADLDLLLVDLADVGTRYYTYAWTALLTARAAVAAGVHTLVLDRPNPISGAPASVEGASQRAEFLSFVGLEPVPIRHALTLGELVARSVEADGHTLGRDGALSLVSPRGWERHATAAAWGRPFVAPSPNMPTLQTALVYPGACLLEGTNLSEGRGTTLPFQTLGAPFLDAERLAADMAEPGTPGALLHPVSFRPWLGKHEGQVCHGVTLHVTDPTLFRPVATYARLITHARAQAPEAFAFETRAYEFETERRAFDLLAGSTAAREAIEAGADAEQVIELLCPADSAWAEQIAAAEERAASAQA
jgi:uncharacterized protein YbbC (DUF1343 family)